MKETFKSIKSGVIIFLTFVLCVSVYGAGNKLLEAKSGDKLKSEDWNKIIANIDHLGTRLEGGLDFPKGIISAFNLNTCPRSWIAADGQNGTPDLRGVFIRGANDFGTGESTDKFNIDVDRQKVGSGAYSIQGDAIRNITGSVSISGGHFVKNSESGFVSKLHGTTYGSGKLGYEFKTADFDASNVVPTGDDNRPRNVALIYCVKE